MKTLDKKLISLLCISFIIIYGSIVFIKAYDNEKKIDFILDSEMNRLKIHYNLMTNQFKIDIKNAHIKLKNNKKALQLFDKAYSATKSEQDKIRKQLQVLLSPQYKRLKNRGVLQFQFVFPDNISFLRMHKSNKYDDDLSIARYSIKYVNDTHNPISGFEQGKTSHGFRYVEPLYNDNKYIGAVEIAFSSEVIQESLLNNHKIHSRFLVRKDIYNCKAWDRDDKVYEYIQSEEHKDFVFTPTQYIDIKKFEYIQKRRIDLLANLKNKIDKKIKTHKPFVLYAEYDENIKVIRFLPISNVQKKKSVAYLISYGNNQNIQNIIKNSNIFDIIIFFTLILLFVFIYKIKTEKRVLQREVQEQLGNLRKKDNLLLHQSRLASMGEMIGNIAHQWRQPLNVLGIKLMTLDMYYKKDLIDDKFIKDHIESSSDTLQHMSDTIDDFRDFFKPEKKKEKFNISEIVKKSVDIVHDSFAYHNIVCEINNSHNIIIYGYKNEFSQVILNLINNAKDALQQNSIKDAKITIDIVPLKDSVVIKVKDNAGGIEQNIINKVFDPYFTTKHKSNGTGLGLYMSKMIIEKNMGGILSVENDKDGAVFTIQLNNINKQKV